MEKRCINCWKKIEKPEGKVTKLVFCDKDCIWAFWGSDLTRIWRILFQIRKRWDIAWRLRRLEVVNYLSDQETEIHKILRKLLGDDETFHREMLERINGLRETSKGVSKESVSFM